VLQIGHGRALVGFTNVDLGPRLYAKSLSPSTKLLLEDVAAGSCEALGLQV